MGHQQYEFENSLFLKTEKAAFVGPTIPSAKNRIEEASVSKFSKKIETGTPLEKREHWSKTKINQDSKRNELGVNDYFNLKNVWEYAQQRAIDDIELLNQWFTPEGYVQGQLTKENMNYKELADTFTNSYNRTTIDDYLMEAE